MNCLTPFVVVPYRCYSGLFLEFPIASKQKVVMLSGWSSASDVGADLQGLPPIWSTADSARGGRGHTSATCQSRQRQCARRVVTGRHTGNLFGNSRRGPQRRLRRRLRYPAEPWTDSLERQSSLLPVPRSSELSGDLGVRCADHSDSG